MIQDQRQVNIDDVPFPLYKSSSLVKNNNEYAFGKIIHTFEIQNGGLFMNSPQITNNMIAPLIHLIANIVRYDSNKEKYTSYHSPVYEVMPSIFIEFAHGSRAGSGF